MPVDRAADWFAAFKTLKHDSPAQGGVAPVERGLAKTRQATHDSASCTHWNTSYWFGLEVACATIAAVLVSIGMHTTIGDVAGKSAWNLPSKVVTHAHQA